MTRIYLDYCATAPLTSAAQKAMVAAMAVVGNPSSVHTNGRQARRVVEDAREAVAAMVAMAPARVVFTASGTEANNMVLRGFPERRSPGRPVLVSAVEHDSVLIPAGDTAQRVPVATDGTVNMAALAERLETLDRAPVKIAPPLMSVMLVNNETGVIQPVGEIAAMVHARGGLMHVDATQAAGRIPLDMRALGADLLTLSAHKLGGPAGVGALVIGDNVDPAPLLSGGGQERGRRAGTENLIGIAGFGAAAAEVDAALARQPWMHDERARLESTLSDRFPQLVVAGALARRVGAVSCLILPGISGETQVMALDLAGIAVSAGSACSSGKTRPSHVLAAMGMSDDAANAVRVSMGWGTTTADIDRFIDAYTAVAGRLIGHA